MDAMDSHVDGEKHGSPQQVEDLESGGAQLGIVSNMTMEEVANAYRGNRAEHETGVFAAVRIYWRALFWMVVMCTGAIAQSYDNLLMAQFFGLPAFQKDFGHAVKGKKGQYQLTSAWQAGLSDGQSIGSIVGYAMGGFLVDRWGHRLVAQAASLSCVALIPILFWAKNIAMLFAGDTVLSIPLGILHAVAPGYALEIVPLSIRHWGPTYSHICEVIGHIIATCVLLGLSSNVTQWAWRIPYAIQWAFPAVMLVPLFFLPNSPWWYVKKNKPDAAIKVLDQLSGGQADSVQALAMMQHTIEYERQVRMGASFWDLFKRKDLRRTEIACGIWISQTFCGFGLKSGVYFFEVAGIPTTDAFALNVGQYGLTILSSIVTIIALSRYGRRALFFFGVWFMFICLLITSILAEVPNQTPSIIWPQAIMVLVRFFAFGFSLGTLPFLVSTEIGSVRLRQKTLSFSLVIYTISDIVSSTVSPYLLNPTALNLKGKGAWFSVGFMLLILLWAYFRLPETKGRTSEEIDILFERGVSARNFSRYVISQEEEFGVAPDKVNPE